MFFNAKQKAKKLVQERNITEALEKYKSERNKWKTDKAELTIKDGATGEIFTISVGEMKKLTANVIKDWEFIGKQQVLNGELGCYSTDQGLLAVRFNRLKAEVMNNGDTKK